RNGRMPTSPTVQDNNPSLPLCLPTRRTASDTRSKLTIESLSLIRTRQRDLFRPSVKPVDDYFVRLRLQSFAGALDCIRRRQQRHQLTELLALRSAHPLRHPSLRLCLAKRE